MPVWRPHGSDLAVRLVLDAAIHVCASLEQLHDGFVEVRDIEVEVRRVPTGEERLSLRTAEAQSRRARVSVDSQLSPRIGGEDDLAEAGIKQKQRRL